MSEDEFSKLSLDVKNRLLRMRYKMNDKEFEKYLDEKYNEIPKNFLKKCVKFLQDEMPQETKDEIIQAHKEHGVNWIGGSHHFFGMYVRNKLRENGFTDDYLPDQNWDDYYIQVLEASVGLREIPT